MADQLNQVPTSLEPIGTFGRNEIPVQISTPWYKFFVSVSSLFTGSGGGSSGASAVLDTIGNAVGGMLGRFASGWQEFTASAPNQIVVMNPSPAPLQLKTVSQLLDLLGVVHGDVLFRGAAGWQVLTPVVGRYLQSQGAGVDPIYVAGTTGSTVTNGIIAAGLTQGTATALTTNWNEVIAVPLNSGVVLGNLGPGQASEVFNQGVNSLSVYPVVGGQIDALSVNIPYPLPVSKSQQFFQLTPTQWRSQQLG